MSAPDFILAAIMGTNPNVNRYLHPVEPTLAEATLSTDSVAPTTSRTSLPFETPESEVEMNQNGRPRRAAAPTKMMSIGPPIPLIQATRVRSSKPKRKAAAIDEEQDEDDVENEWTHSNLARRGTGGKRQQLSRAVVEDPSDDDYDDDVPAAPHRKKGQGKYANITKSNRKASQRASSQASTTSPTTSTDKEKDKSKVPEAKRKADQANALLGRKGKGRSIPVRVEECDPVDLMMWQWRHSGRSWDDIRKEYVSMTGQMPGRSSLSVRLAKMEDNFIDSGGASDILLLKFKEDVEKELDGLRWQRIAEKWKMETKRADTNAGALRKRYNAIKASGWLLGDAVAEDVKTTKPKPDLAALLAETHAAADIGENATGDVDRDARVDDVHVDEEEGEQDDTEGDLSDESD